jgi:two-component system nitrogen regulation sensor histidine kinase NtrY
MSIDSTSSAAGWRRFTPRWPLRPGLNRGLAVAVAIAASIFGIATYVLLTGPKSLTGGDLTTILVLLNIDLVFLLLLGALIAWHLVRLWIERRQGSVGSRMHARIVGMFSIVAITPAIIVAVFSAAFFNLGIQSWFNEKVRTAFDRSLAVSEAYLRDHREFIRADILSMLATLNRQDPSVLSSPDKLSQLLDSMATERSLAEAIIFKSDGTGLARSRMSFLLEFDPIPIEDLRRAADGELVVKTSDGSDRLRALAKIDNMVGAFLYIGRYVDPAVLNHRARLIQVESEYKALEERRSDIQLFFTLLYGVVALLLLLAAVWTGLVFANRLTRPISALVGATERVRAGDLSVRVTEGPVGDEIAALSRAFNRMTGQLDSQRAELVEANTQIDNRRRFTEAVLYGVSSGVLGLDRERRIFLPNQTALDLLAGEAPSLIGQPLERAVPEMADLMSDLRAGAAGQVQGKVSIIRNERARELLVRISAQRTQGQISGFVVTFDDITDLVHAQRTAAWADVARRVAHEIKNPLTPIQLSAERLRRKYRAQLGEGDEVFADCVDTIVRQVRAIRGMVDEFSAFARMPAPVLVEADLNEIVESAVALQRHAHPEIAFEVAVPTPPAALHCDAAQVGQVMTNLLQNAIDAIDGRAGNGAGGPPGRIAVRLDASSAERITVAIDDNGRGLPEDLEQRSRLTEPYVTTRERGTGLGLAIVKKIMEDHGGVVQLTDGPMGGARAFLVFPRRSPARPAQGPGLDGAESVR